MNGSEGKPTKLSLDIDEASAVIYTFRSLTQATRAPGRLAAEARTSHSL